MGLDPESDPEEFLARQSPWVRKVLRGDYAFTADDRAAMLGCNWPEVFAEAQGQYRELLKGSPEKLRAYRKLQAKLGERSALFDVPSLPAGAPREDALAREARELEQAGLSQSDIAAALNRKYPNRKDRKGNKKPLTVEAIRKSLSRRRETPPDKT